MTTDDQHQRSTLSRHQLENRWRKYFPAVEPESVCVDNLIIEKWKGERILISEEEINGQIIPFKKALKQMLSVKSYADAIQHSFTRNRSKFEKRNSKIYEDIWDGELITNNKIYIENKGEVLGIQLWYDDVELANTLGSRRGNKCKMAIFFWTLINLPPNLRSSLSSINMLGVIESQLLKTHKPAAFLKSFVEDLRDLENGEYITVQGHSRKWVCLLLNCAGDHLASNYLAGFKESVSKAHKPCRICKIERGQVDNIHKEIDCILRDKFTYEQELQSIVQENDEKKKCELSKQYGIVEECCFNRLSYFDTTKRFPHDIMHLMDEGVLNLECSLLLNTLQRNENSGIIHYINEKLDQIISPGGFVKFPKLKQKQISDLSKLSYSASEMQELANVLPLILSDLVSFQENENYCNFLLLLEIHSSLKCYKFTEDDLRALTDNIELHNRTFVELYRTLRQNPNVEDPNPTITPKLHALIHLPSQIRYHGPPRYSWSFRYESKNVELKRIMRRNCNNKNVAYSVAIHTQRLAGLDFAVNDDFFGPGHDDTNVCLQNIRRLNVKESTVFQLLTCATGSALNSDENSEFQCASSFKILGRLCYEGTIFLKFLPPSLDELPIFWSIDEIVSINGKITLAMNILETESFNYNSFSFLVSSNKRNLHLATINDLREFPVRLRSYTYNNKIHVIPDYYHLV